ncbi:hypothetical protein D3C73_921780 [compost metagenome]
MSAPKSVGEMDNGENVLSTISFSLYFLQMAESFLKSATCNKGLLTLSQYSTFVLGLIDLSSSSASLISKNVVSIWKGGRKFLRKA